MGLAFCEGATDWVVGVLARAGETIDVRLTHRPFISRQTPGPPDVPLTTLPLPPSTVVEMVIEGKPGGGGGLAVSCWTLVSDRVPEKLMLKVGRVGPNPRRCQVPPPVYAPLPLVPTSSKLVGVMLRIRKPKPLAAVLPVTPKTSTRSKGCSPA